MVKTAARSCHSVRLGSANRRLNPERNASENASISRPTITHASTSVLRSTLFWVENMARTSRYPSVNRLASRNLRIRRRCLNSSGGADGRSPTGSAPGITVDSRSVRLACRIATLPLGSPLAYMLRRY